MEMVNKLLKLNYKVIVVPHIQNPEFKLIHSCRKNLVISLFKNKKNKNVILAMCPTHYDTKSQSEKVRQICQFNLQEVELFFLAFVYGERRM